jgi:cell division septation protein DedD
MRNNETGEFELVVGNRQLLSAFFIVVLLFAVSFAMGYVVGQNTQHSVKTAETPSSTLAAPNTSDRPQPLAPVATSPTPATTTPAEQQPTDPNAPPQPTTQPVQPATPPATDQQPTPTAPAGTASANGELPPGSFWQVMAVGQSTAEAVRQTLKDKGFPVVLTPGTNNLTRVLVGPYTDNAALGRAKTDLEEAGMHPLRFKREQ